jgi:hypothetical protein
MATAYITYHQSIGPSQTQAPQGHLSDATPLVIGAEAHTAAVTASCLAEVSCDAIMNITYGPSATATATTGQRLPANTFAYFLWLNNGDRISVITNT